MEDNPKLSITTIKGGAAVEMFDLALSRVLQNVGDINTTLKPREIILKVKIVPSSDRTLAGYEITCGTRLAGQETISGTADLRIDSRGRHFAEDRQKNQAGLPFKTNNVKEVKFAE